MNSPSSFLDCNIQQQKIDEIRKKNRGFFAYHFTTSGKNYYFYLLKMDSLEVIYVHVPKS